MEFLTACRSSPTQRKKPPKLLYNQLLLLLLFLFISCPMDSTMIYRYYPSSSVQNFSIKSFRFLRTSKRLVYLHCELLVCHRNSINSRCSFGCLGSRRRRDADDYDDTSNSYGLSTGPIAGDKIDSSETDQNEGKLTLKLLITC